MEVHQSANSERQNSESNWERKTKKNFSALSDSKSSDIKQSMSTQSEVTSLGPDSKRRRHHRRKPNKNRRSKDLTKVNEQAKDASKNCRKFRKPLPKGLSGNQQHHQQQIWRRKRNNFCKNGKSGPGTAFSGQQSNGHRTAGSGRKRPNMNNVVLRPTKVPLLNAPRNSTQFIIDDHESSDLIWTFETKQQKKNQSPSENNDGDSAAAGSSPSPNVRRVSSESDSFEIDEDTFWNEYSERDFQSVYETAHQEEIAKWDRKKLMEEIASLERRHKELVKVLSRLDPQVYVTKLQQELSRLQEQNQVLRSGLEESGSEGKAGLPPQEQRLDHQEELEQEEIVAMPEEQVRIDGDLVEPDYRPEVSDQPDSSSEGQSGGIDDDSTVQRPTFVFNSPDSTN